MAAPVRFQKAVSRSKEKPQWSAARRAGTRYGPAVPSRRRDRSDRKTGQRSRRSAAANFGAPLPSFGNAKGSKPTIWHDSPPGCAARQRSRSDQINVRKRMMSKFQSQISAGACEARLLRGACHRAGQRPDPLARNDVDGSANAVIARSAQRDEAISATRTALRPCRILAERTREVRRGWPEHRRAKRRRPSDGYVRP